MRTQDLENEAERLVRRAATDHLPVDAGIIGQVTSLIRDAYDRGQEELRDLAEAELRELEGSDDPGEAESVRTFLEKLHFYGVPESADEELSQLGRP